MNDIIVLVSNGCKWRIFHNWGCSRATSRDFYHPLFLVLELAVEDNVTQVCKNTRAVKYAYSETHKVLCRKWTCLNLHWKILDIMMRNTRQFKIYDCWLVFLLWFSPPPWLAQMKTCIRVHLWFSIPQEGSLFGFQIWSIFWDSRIIKTLFLNNIFIGLKTLK